MPYYPLQRRTFHIETPPPNGKTPTSNGTAGLVNLFEGDGAAALVRQFEQTGSYSRDELSLLEKLLSALL